MADHYVDPDATGADDGSSWANAWHNLADFFAHNPAAGDVCYCRSSTTGHEHPGAQISPATSGSNAAGWIKVIGCNASGQVDGTRYIIDAAEGDYDIIDLAGQDLWWWENIEVKNAGGTTQNGWYSSVTTCVGHVWINCCSNGNTGSGWNNTNIGNGIWYRCVSYGNDVNGWISSQLANRYYFCCARDNAADGWSGMISADMLIGCISQSNTDDGISLQAQAFNCVIDNNDGDGVEINAGGQSYPIGIVGCRMTTNGHAGIYTSSTDPVFTAFNYFEDNVSHTMDVATYIWDVPTSAAILTSGSLVAGTQYRIENYTSNDDFTNVGAASNANGIIFFATGTTPTHWEHGTNIITLSSKAGLANTNQGYVDATEGAPDLSTNYVSASDPSIRRDAITIPYS